MRQTEARSEPFSTTRELVDFINDHHITKTDIVTVLYIGYQLFLIYYA